MPRQHGLWTIHESNRVYRNPFIEVVEDRVIRPDGHPGTVAGRRPAGR